MRNIEDVATLDTAAAPPLSALSQTLALASCGMLGGLVGGFTDLMQKGHASGIKKIATTVHNQLGVAFPALAALVVVAAMAGVLCFVFEWNTKKKAFLSGLGVISVLTTGVPHTPAPAEFPANGADNTRPTGTSGSLWDHLVPRAFAAGPTTGSRSRELTPVTLRLHASKPTDEVREVTVTVRDRQNPSNIVRRIFPKLTDREAKEAFIREVSLRIPPGDYSITIEMHGFTITERVVKVEAGQPQALKVVLEPSMVPLFLQRSVRN
jgi:PEGA domain